MAPATENKSDRLPDLAVDLVRRQVAAIVELRNSHGISGKGGNLRDPKWF